VSPYIVLLMTQYDIEGVKVSFPYEDAYSVQIEFMRSVIKCLNSASNALLESPTGTGKTLSLLCATLAWHESMSGGRKGLKHEIKTHPSIPATGKDVNIHTGSTGTERGFGSGAIIYASRTHSQLAQVVKELKETKKKCKVSVKVSVLGSREQLCVHPRVGKLKGSAINFACNSLCSSRKCHYKNNLENHPIPDDIRDIEDMCKMGRKREICPYFYSRSESETSQLILMPYNYLLDKSIRNTLKVPFENSTIIFDEAHNLESIASEGASFALSSTDIAVCIKELQQALELLQLMRSSSKSSKTEITLSSITSSDGKKTLDVSEATTVVVRVLKALFDFESRLDSLPLSTQGDVNGMNCSVQQGSWLIRLLEVAGFSVELARANIEGLNLVANLLLEQAALAAGESVSAVPPPEPRLVLLTRALSRVYTGTTRSACEATAGDYKVFVCEEELSKKLSSAEKRNPFQQSVMNNTRNTGRRGRILNYWCFSPGIAMLDLKKLGVRSFILTSGTLSPLGALRTEMKLPFPIELESPHVIDTTKQVWVHALDKGPSGVSLNSNFQNRDSPHYKDELGASILAIHKSMRGLDNNGSGRWVLGGPSGPQRERAVPLSGGVLVFFPSYALMEAAYSRWKETNLLSRLTEMAGEVIVEPRGALKGSSKPSKFIMSQNRSSSNVQKKKDVASSSSSSFGKAPSTPGSTHTDNADDEAELKGIVEQFYDAVDNKGKCLLLAVCRGKVSEGIDFRDKRGRVVIITGLPYSPFKDPRVKLKKKHLDERKVAKSGTLSGEEWYLQSAVRAVNQAIGRVIRHSKDYGAIFLLDSRFQTSKVIGELSGWVRAGLKRTDQFGTAIASFREFASKAIELYGKNGQTKDDKKNSETSPLVVRRELTIRADEIDGKEESFVPPDRLLTQAEGVLVPDDATFSSEFQASEVQNDFNSMIAALKKGVSASQSVKKELEPNKRRLSSSTSHLTTVFNTARQESRSAVLQKPSLKSWMRGDKNPTKDISSRTHTSLFKPQKGSDDNENGGPKRQRLGGLSTGHSGNPNHSFELFSQSSRAKHPSSSDVYTNQVEAKRSTGGDEGDVTVPKQRLRSALDIACAGLSNASAKELESLVLSKQDPQIEDISDLKRFVRNLCRLVCSSEGTVADFDGKAALESLHMAVPLQFTDVYLQLVRRCCSRLKDNKIVPSINEPSDGKADSSFPETNRLSMYTLQNPKDSGNITKGNSVSGGLSSKRAGLILNSCSNSFREAERKRADADHKKLEETKQELARRREGFQSKPNGAEVKSTISTKNVLKRDASPAVQKKYICVICRDAATDPLAPRCGHTCCHSCWKTWLKLRQFCPSCREPVEIEKLTRLRVIG
jgi:regulator of telomere elongation helicase 1